MCVSLISDVCNTRFRPGQIPVEALYADAAKYRAAVAADDEAPLVAVIFFFLVVHAAVCYNLKSHMYKEKRR